MDEWLQSAYWRKVSDFLKSDKSVKLLILLKKWCPHTARRSVEKHM